MESSKSVWGCGGEADGKAESSKSVWGCGRGTDGRAESSKSGSAASNQVSVGGGEAGGGGAGGGGADGLKSVSVAPAPDIWFWSKGGTWSKGVIGARGEAVSSVVG